MSSSAAQQKSDQPTSSDYNWQTLKCILPENIASELSSNRPPSAAALQFAKAVCDDPSMPLQAAKLRICKLDEEIGKLQAERAILSDESYIRTSLKRLCSVISSPIRRIPDDIIREILQHATEKTPYPAPERNSAPLSFARVCSAWRFVVLSSPRLWSRLYLRVANVSHRGIKPYYQAVETWFRRAQTLPLQLFLYIDSDDTPATRTHSSYVIKLFLKTLSPWASRIHRLGLGSQNWAGLMHQFADIEWDLRELRRLDILGQRQFDADLAKGVMCLQSVMERITIFRNSNLLNTVVALQEISLYFDQLAFIPWKQITNLSLDEEQCDLSYIPSIFQSFPLLRNASLRVDAEYGRDALPPLPLSHAHLVTLDLQLKTPDYAGVVALFTHIIFPRLEFLSLYIIQPDGARLCETGRDFGKFVPFPSLTTLILKDEPLPTRFVLNLLLNCPLLKTLDISIHDGPKKVPMTNVNTLCQRLTIVTGHCDLAPFLEECVFRYERRHLYDPEKIFTLDGALVSRFVHSRTLNVPPGFNHLKKLTFTGGFQFLTDIQQEIDTLALPTIIQSPTVAIIPPPQDFAIKRHMSLDFDIPPFGAEMYTSWMQYAYTVAHREIFDM